MHRRRRLVRTEEMANGFELYDIIEIVFYTNINSEGDLPFHKTVYVEECLYKSVEVACRKEKKATIPSSSSSGLPSISQLQRLYR